MSLALLAGNLTACGIPKPAEQFLKETGLDEKIDNVIEDGTEALFGTVEDLTGNARKDRDGSEDGRREGGDVWNFQSFEKIKSSKDYKEELWEGETLFRNPATYYHYYTQLSEEEKEIYKGMQELIRNPVSTEYKKRVDVAVDPASEEFTMEITRAYEAMIFDHPEYFWFRQNNGNFSYYYNPLAVGGSYKVMIQMTEAYENYETEMTLFNQAVDDFLADIDLNQSEEWIALQIHDKLIDLVQYDDALAEDFSGGGSSYDYGYSAYGALVCNSRGEANTCVCDGYSYAYEYLLQMVGIPVTRVGGLAGETDETAGSHSWNLVFLGDEWYETDPTWDDVDPKIDQDDPNAYMLESALSDPAYWNQLRHHMYNRTTEDMRYFEPDDSYTYYWGDGSYATFLGPSVHIREDGSDPEDKDYMSQYAPIATGTQYSYSNMIAY